MTRFPSNPTGSPRLRLHHAWLLLPLATALLLSWHSLSDRDVWFHARAGRDLLAEGHLARVNRYSYTAPDHPWLNHEWLFQTAVAVTAPDLPPESDDPLLGWSALRLLLVLGLLLVLMLGDGGLAPGVPHGRIALTAAASLAALGLIWTRLTLRPELVSYALLAVLVRAAGRTLAAAAGPGRWRDWIDPRRTPGQATFATLLWAQVHGFSGLAPAVWLLALAAALAERRGREAIPLARRALVGLALACVALALTPNGPAGLLYPLRALGQFRGDQPRLGGMIAELVPLLDTRDALGTTLLVFKVSLAWCGLWIIGQWGRIPLLRVLVLALAAAAALAAQRALGLYAVAFVLLHTGTVWPLRRVGRLRLPTGLQRAGLPVLGLLLVAVCAVWWPAIHSDRFYLGEGVARRWGAGLTPAHVPLGALAELERSGAPTLLTNVDAAGAALALGSAAVFIDGRTEAYPPALWRDYAALRSGGAAAAAVLSRWHPRSVLLAYGSGAFAVLTAELLTEPAWRLAAIDGAGALFLPADGRPPADPRQAAAALLAAASRPDQATARAADLCLAAARTLELAADHGGAAAALARGAALRPEHPQVQHNLGNARMKDGDFPAALAAFTAAFAANGRQAGSALNAGVCALRLGRADEASRWFARAVAVDPQRFEAWVNLAVVREREGDRAGARRALERAVELRPDDPRLRERLRGL